MWKVVTFIAVVTTMAILGGSSAMRGTSEVAAEHTTDDHAESKPTWRTWTPRRSTHRRSGPRTTRICAAPHAPHRSTAPGALR